MPFMSDKELAKTQGFFAKQKDRAKRVAEKAREKQEEFVSTMECVGGAAAMGYLRGWREKGGNQFTIMGADIEMITGISLIGMSYFDLFGKWDKDVLNIGNGIMAHYTGQVARKFAVQGWQGTGSLIGMEPAHVGALPQHAPFSGPATQMGSPYADPVASAIDESGI